MCSHWTEAKLFKFLRLYKRYECLWNPYSPEYGNSDAKSNAFSRILSEMNVFGLTINECLNQLKQIRSTYKLEQQRLESIAFLGGSTYSNLLWYPLMNSMLSKVIKDEEKLNQAIGNPSLIMTPERLPFNSGDQRSQRDLNRIGYGRGTFSWDPNRTRTMCPYSTNSNFQDYGNGYPNPNRLNKSVGMSAPNEHIGSCPTCGYSSCGSCNCFSMDTVGYSSDYIGQSFTPRSEINYQPRTSYNYRNGILEINSAVRIPVSQPSPSYGYSNMIESIMPEESEYFMNPIFTNRRPEVQTGEEGEEFSIKCGAKSPNCNNAKNKENKEYKFQKIVDHVAGNDSNPPNFLAIKNIDWCSKKSKRTEGNVDDVQNFLGSIGVAKNSICKSTQHENSVADNSKSSRFTDQGNQTNDILQHTHGIESKKLFDIEHKIETPSPEQQSIVNMKAEKSPKSEVNMTNCTANVKVEQTSTMALENEQPVKDDIQKKLLRVKPECNEDLTLTAKCSRYKNCQTNLKLNLAESAAETKAECALYQESLPAVINDCKEKIYDADTDQGIERKPKHIIENKLTKMVIDFIDESLDKPAKRSSVDAKEKLALKKMAKVLRAIGDESHCDFNDELAVENHREPHENGKVKFCKKTICWREPIAESLNIVPCKSIRNGDSKTNYREDALNERPVQLNKGKVHCFRMMAGADFDFDNDTKQCNLSRQMDTQSNDNTTIISPDFGKHSGIGMNKKQQHDDEKNTENVAVVLSNEVSQTNRGEYALSEVTRSIPNFEAVRREDVESVARNDMKSKKSSIIIDQLCQAEESIDLDSQSVEIDGRIITMGNELHAESYGNEMDDSECFSARSTIQDVMEIESSVTINISVRTSGSTENELIDEVVNKITRVLRKTLDNNGYAIEKKQFFTRKNLITNDNGEINEKLIGNEAVWKTELRNIVRHLMKHEKAGDSITFKVKTMILPVINESNVTAEGITDLRRKVDKSVEGLNQTESKMCNERFKDPDCDVLISESNRGLQVKKQLLKYPIKRSSKRSKHIIPHCKLENKAHREKVSTKDAARIVSPYKNYPHALWKLLKYLVKFRNKFQTMPKGYEKLLRDNLHGDKYDLTNYTKFEHNYQKRDFVATNFSDKLQHNRNEGIDVYLCTEISQDAQSSMVTKTSCNHCSDSSVPNDVNEDSLRTDITMRENRQMRSSADNCVQKSENKSEQDVSEWESFSGSDEEVSEIVKSQKHRDEFSCQISKGQPKKIISTEKYGLEGNSKRSNRYYPNNYSLVDTSHEELHPTASASHRRTKSTLWDRKRAKQVELLDSIIQPTDKEYPMPSETNALKNVPDLRNSCKIVDVFSSDNQNMSRAELRSSEEGGKASSRCTEFDEAEAKNQDQIPNPSESEENHSLLEAKLRKATDIHIESCCTRDNETRSKCTPICNVTSRLRLCAITRSPDETSTANHDISSSNICCCNELYKSKNADGPFPKPPIRPSRKNVMIGNGSVRLTTASCQTKSFERDMNILEQERGALDQGCRGNLGSNFPISRNKEYTENSATKDAAMKQVQNNVKSSVSTSVDTAALGEESLILEIKMLQPLFSIEMKKGRKVSGKSGATIEHDSDEFLEPENHNVNVCSGENSVMKPGQDSVLFATQQSVNRINQTTSTNSIHFGLQKTNNQEAELSVWKGKRETSSCETQTSQICVIETNSEKRIEVLSDTNASLTSMASNTLKKNASTRCRENCDSLDLDQCNRLLEMLKSLRNYQNLHGINSNEFLGKDSKAKAIPQPKENFSGETKSMTIEALISNLETNLRHITDPIIYKNFADTIKYMRDKNQNQNYPASDEIYLQDQTCGSLEQTLQKNERDSEDNIRPKSVLSISDGSQCQKPCKSQTVVTANTAKNIRGMVADVEILQDGNTSLQSEGTAGNSQTKMGSSKGPGLPREEVANQTFENELQGHSRLTSTENYFSNEISGDIEGLNMNPQLQNNEGGQPSKNYCCHGKSTAVDINVFASMVASQLRGLSTEAALRSQQRIQTLISKSRLESEKNKKHRYKKLKMVDDRNGNNRKTKSKVEPMDDNQQWWLRFVPNSEQWSDVNISRFLNIYKTHPILWDPTHSFYKDQSRRMKTYAIIAGKLNLHDIKDKECMRLVESLKDLYAAEKERQTIAKKCSHKYTPPPAWYRMLEDMIEYVHRKLANPAADQGSLSIKADSEEPWKACCSRLYTEDIWTPRHFKTNVMDWFLTPQDERLLCTCKQFPETAFNNNCSVETSFVCHGDSSSDSSSEIDQCVAETLSHSSKICCDNRPAFKLPEECGVDVNNDEIQTCNGQKLKKKEDIESLCKSCTINGDEKKLANTAQCLSENTMKRESDIQSCSSEAMYCQVEKFNHQRASVEKTCCGNTDYQSNTPKTVKECKTKERQHNLEKKLVLHKNNDACVTISEKERDVLDICEREAVDEVLDGIYTCSKNNTSLSRDASMSQEVCDVKYKTESTYCGQEKKTESKNIIGKSRLDKPALKSNGIRFLRPCGAEKLRNSNTFQTTACGCEGSIVSSKSETSSPTKSRDTCCSDSNATPVTPSSSSSHHSTLLPDSRSLSETEVSDHRLHFQPDPTLCPKCAADRVPVREVHQNIMHFRDPRMPELDKYCWYKDWDEIYKIRTHVPDEEPVFQIEEDLVLMIKCKDEPLRPKRQNHLPIETDIHVFIDPKSSEGRQVSLNNEYKREYGLYIKNPQPIHYACEASEVLGHKSAQLIL